MARIGFAIGPTSEIRIHEYPAEDYPDRHHVWLTISGANAGPHDTSDELTFHIGSYGIPTDEQVVASSSLLIAALETVRQAATDRLAARVKADLPEPEAVSA